MSESRPEAPGAWVGHATELGVETGRPGRVYREFLRSGSLSAGTYVLPAGAIDPQRPHREDEVYIVWEGEATLQIGERAHRVRSGSVAFVAAGRPHRFVDVKSKLTVLVVFAPPESEP